MIGKALESFDGMIKLASAFFRATNHARSGLEQIRSTDRADKDKVSREDAHWYVRAAAFIGQDEGDVLGSVPRSMHYLQLDFAHLDYIAVLEQLAVVLVGELVLPIRRAFIGEIELCVDSVG